MTFAIPRHARPECVYREERRNKHGEWVLSRFTFDKALWEKWMNANFSWQEKFKEPVTSAPYRYVYAKIGDWIITADSNSKNFLEQA